MSDISVVWFGLVDVLFFLAQFNRVGTTVRWSASLIAVGLHAVILIFSPRLWPAALIALALLFLALAYKWDSEVTWDVMERETAGMEPLIKVQFKLAALAWSPTFLMRYRRRMFRDEWSRQELLARSVTVPERFRDRAPES
jgi:hypothetical protein